MPVRLFVRYGHIIIYGCSLAVLLLLLKWLEWRFLVVNYAIEIYSGAIAIVFTGLGIWLALKLARPKPTTLIVEREAPVSEQEITRLGLSARELEVLRLMAGGLSNQEIAACLFLSLNTIKTHSSRIFEKLDARRRTQAIDKAKKLNIIP
jgi:two-component system, NarL family, response regulator LiaR